MQNMNGKVRYFLAWLVVILMTAIAGAMMRWVIVSYHVFKYGPEIRPFRETGIPWDSLAMTPISAIVGGCFVIFGGRSVLRWVGILDQDHAQMFPNMRDLRSALINSRN